MTKLAEIYNTMFELGLVRNQEDFNINWLGRSRCYLSYLKKSGAHPSLSSVALLVAKLEPEVDLARQGDDPSIYRPLRSALVSAKVILAGVYELRNVPPWYRITAI